jgi:hypothetical protein
LPRRHPRSNGAITQPCGGSWLITERPNEHALPAILREGLLIMTGLFWDLGESERNS